MPQQSHGHAAAGEAPVSTPQDVRRYRENHRGEVDGAYLYRMMAAHADDARLSEVYERLAAVEQRHAAFWAERLRTAGAPVDEVGPTARARILGWLAQRFGTEMILPAMAAEEARGQTMYDDQPETEGTSMRADERSHARLLRTIVGSSADGLEGGALARLEGRHRAVTGGNALRAAVLGANDGLVSNLSLVMGVAGASVGARGILITGLAGLLAGACSMALGEWISVRSATELAERQLRIEKAELEAVPEEEREELRLIYMAKGLPEAQAAAVAERMLEDPDNALDVMAREELGLDPDELAGSAGQAAAYSFVLFAVGAAVPVLPFVFAAGVGAIALSLVASGLALFGIGAAITLLTGRSAWWSGGRQLLFGLAAAAVTFGIGSLLNTTVA